MRKKNAVFLILVIAIGAIGCKHIIKESNANSIIKSRSVNGIELPNDPGELTNRTIVGVDSNSNGVRDDVEIYIAEKYGVDKDKFNAIMEFSRKKQAMLVVSLEDEEAAKKINIWGDSSICLSKKISVSFNEANYINEGLIDQVFNNWERQAYYQDIMIKSGKMEDSPENYYCD